MSRVLQFTGIIGLVFVVFGLVLLSMVGAGLVSDRYLLAEIHLGVGFVFLALFFVIFMFRGGLRFLGSTTVKRTAGFGAGVFVYSALFLAILGLLNYYALKHEIFYYDSTEQKVFTLAPQTRSVLGSLEHPLLIRAFYLAGDIPSETRTLLNRMANSSDKVEWKTVDPEKTPRLVQQLGINEPGTLHFSYDKREFKIFRETSEQEIVNAVLKLISRDKRTLYVLSGHGEGDMSDQTPEGFGLLRLAIEGENFEIKELLLGKEGRVPENASALLVIAPKRDFLPSERKAIEDYLENGGNALFLYESRTTEDIRVIAAAMGISVGNDVVIDQILKPFSAPGMGVEPVVTLYGRHPVTKGFDQATLFSMAASVRPAEKAPKGASVTALAMTNPNSWAERNLELLFSDDPKARLEPEEDIEGPVSIAVAFEGHVPSRTGGSEALSKDVEKSRAIVIGDSHFVSNGHIRKLFNRDFFLNSLNWVVGEELGVTIRPRTLRESQHVITAEQLSSVFLTAGVLFPEVLLLLGLGIWWFRIRE